MTSKSRTPSQLKGATSDIYYMTLESPVGELLLAADDEALRGLYFGGCAHVPIEQKTWRQNDAHPMLQRVAKQLEEYFGKNRTSFDVPLRLEGTGFQEKVWQQIALIPYGKTISYTELAERAGASHAVRAAGTTTGRNPISIIIPCHRVVAKDGKMCGFAGGLENKEFLLEFESSRILRLSANDHLAATGHSI